MATQVQFRRGTTTQNNAFTGAAGEISVDTDLKTIRLHDGVTAGGGSTMLNTISTQTALNKTFSTGSVWQGTAVGLGYGGTGSSLTATAGAVAYSTASGLGLTAAGTSGQVLVSGGINAPTWVSASSISAGTATLATTATNIAGGSAGQLIIQADTGLSTFITAGPSGTFLRSAGAGYAPTWATADVTIGSTVIDLGSSTASLNGLNILAATGTSHWLIPVGTTAQRPASPSQGMIRYNTSQTTFEGYSAGAWSSLGGVTSVDKYTYIVAETSPTASNGDLDFYAENSAGNAAQQVGQWNRTNLKDYTGTIVGTQTTQNVFNSVATTVNAFGAATTLTIGATSGTTTVRNNLTVTGDLTINGTTTTVNATTITVDDKNIELGSVASPTNTTADGGGITLKGATDKTLNWINATGAWTSSEDFNLVTGKVYEINGTEVLSASTVFNSQTTASIAPSATTLTIGATSGTATIRNSTVAITNAATVGSTLGVTGATTLSSTLAVTGATTLSSALTYGGVTLSNAVTGTGSMVLSTSPSLTTPTIGGGGANLSGATSGSLNLRAAAAAGTGVIVTIPATTGTIVTTGDTGTVTSTMIADGTIVNGDISASAAIAVSKLAASTISGVTLGNNLNTLTLNVSGTGLSGSTTYNGSAAATFTVTLSSTSANTASTVVARDGSGNFAAGTITASAFQVSSDARLKTNIENSSYGLSEVLQLRSVKYIKNNKVEIGLIAQEVETVLPEFVGEGDDGMKTVNYGQMVSVLVKAVQDLQKEVASLKAKLGE